MRWFRRCRTKADEREAAEDVRAAEDALRDLEQAMESAVERTSEISKITRTLRAADGRNHFTLMIRDALRGDFQ